MDLYDIAIAKKLSSSGGGGGSSDFSTAEVTINATIEGSPTLVSKSFHADTEYPEGSVSPYSGSFPDFTGNVLLYENKAIIYLDSIGASDSNEQYYVGTDTPTPTTTGNATFDDENSAFIITGNCTINVTLVPAT